MNKDIVVATYEERPRLDDFHYELVDQQDDYLPYGFAKSTIGLTAGKSQSTGSPSSGSCASSA